MSFADVAPAPSSGFSIAVLACAGLACLFVVSAIVLTVVLVKRGRKS